MPDMSTVGLKRFKTDVSAAAVAIKSTMNKKRKLGVEFESGIDQSQVRKK